jgi:hypothetical protein
MIVFGRVKEAPGRRPTPRAHADLTQNPEIGLTRRWHILEQRTQERDLRCASAPRCLFRIDMELPSRFLSWEPIDRSREDSESLPSVDLTLSPLSPRTPCIRSQMRRPGRSYSGAVRC